MDEAERADYVERVARILEAGGESRITGRIYAHLATTDEPYLGLQQLADELGVSRASVSTNTRRLIAQGMLERVAVPGARGEHYRLTASGPEVLLAAAAARAREIAALAQEGLDLLGGTVTSGAKSLRSMRDSYTELARAIDGRKRRTGRTAAR